MGNPDFRGMGTWWESAYDNRGGSDEMTPQEVEFAKSHTHELIIGEVRFSMLFTCSFRRIAGNKMYAEIDMSYIPHECIPNDVSRESVDTYVMGASRNKIKGDFVRQDDGAWKATTFLENMNLIMDKVRKMHKIVIGNEEYNFPVTSIGISAGQFASAQAQVNGKIFPLRRKDGHWVLSA